jgi:hypothetical protein
MESQQKMDVLMAIKFLNNITAYNNRAFSPNQVGVG